MAVKDKRILVTGASSGIGLATAQELALQGASQVVMAVRSLEKGEAAKKTLLQTGDIREDQLLVVGGFDMLSPQKIAAAVPELSNEPIDAVFLNAGGWVYTDNYQTENFNGETIEKTIFQNVFGSHVTLSELLRQSKLSNSARVVTSYGEGARGLGPIPKPGFESVKVFLDYAQAKGDKLPEYKPPASLGASKFYSAIWSQRLSQELRGRHEVVCMSPGFTATAGIRGLPKPAEFLFKNVGFPILVALGKAQTTSNAAKKCVDVISGRVGQSGDILGAPGGKGLGNLVDQKPLNAAFTNDEFQSAFWDLIVQTVGDVKN